MEKKYSAFSYKNGNSFLHKCPSWIKLIFVPIVNILFLCLPLYFCVSLIFVQFVIAFYLKFSVREQFKDVKVVLWYAIVLFTAKVFSVVSCSNFYWDNFDCDNLNLKNFIFTNFFCWENNKETIFLLLKIFCIMQSASLVFKTSTSLQLREGLQKIELAIRRIFFLKQKTGFSNVVFMFVNFIPMIFKIWEQIEKAWIVRNGKKNILKYFYLMPVLFSVGIKKAYNLSKAIAVREL